MIQFVKKSLLFVCCLCAIESFAQTNLFDSAHVKDYASYLFKTGDFEQAYEEYSRLHLLDSANVYYQTMMIKTLRLKGDIRQALNVAKAMYQRDSLFPQTVSTEYLHTLFYSDYRHQTEQFVLKSRFLDAKTSYGYRSLNALLDQNIVLAQQLLAPYKNDTSYFIQNINTILLADKSFKPKNKGLALAMSAFLPGSGKVYLGAWKDGLAAFVYTGLSAWQSYRGFSRKGINSIYGWGFTAVGTGFYLGNIYGTAKRFSIRKENHQLSIKKQVLNVVEASFK
jgi:hypothetical protein